jgi:SAM-dependent methyltransferase
MSAQAREAYDAAADVYDDFTAHHDYDGWTALIERLARAHGLAGDRLLDVGCGTGNSFLPFLERGYRITACDISPRMLARAREKCDGRARLSVADLRSLPRLGSFDLVLAIDDVLNYLTAAELPAAFRGLAANLAAGGVLVFDVNTELTYRTFFAGSSRQGRLTWEGHVDAEGFQPGDVASATLDGRSRHVQHHHPPRIVQAALAVAGLRPAAIHGMDLTGALATPVDEEVHTKALFTCVGRR